MKKAWILILALLLGLCLLACGQPTAPEHQTYTFPEGTAVLGVDMTGLTKEEACSKLEAAAADYQLELTVDGITVPVTAQEIDLRCSRDDLLAGLDALFQNVPADLSQVISFNEGKLRALMSQYFNKDVTEASICFDEAEGKYVVLAHADGQKSNPNALVAAVKEAVVTLTPTQTLTGVSEILHPQRTADAPEVLAALDLANRMIGTRLTYTFGDASHEISEEDIRSFVTVAADGLTPVMNDSTLDTYVTTLSDTYSTEGTTGPFRTTGGSTIDLTVSYSGNYVDVDKLKQDIITCMQEGISETREAPYASGSGKDMPYGGTYIEVNLSSQHLWFYKNGELLVSTPLVSGKVVAEYCTPTGIYSIYDKDADTYLVGADYRSYVNYWMPFHYGYGLHDATWRGSFGGEIYLYSGSHGCVNLPLKAAGTIYNNASVGTKVILYGGVRSVPPLDQSFTGTTSYDVADDVGTIKLNIQPRHSDPKMTYKSSNPNVAAVSDSGVVTIKSVGKAKITVSVPKHEGYEAKETTVTINVHSACEEGRHTMGKPVTVKKPTCQPGLEKATCTKCSHTEEKELKAVDSHTYGEWVTVKAPTCKDEGTKEQTCTKCGIDKKTGTIPVTDKHTEGSWVTAKEPTCVEEGSRQTKCTVCDTVLRTEAIAPTGKHVAGEWKTVTEPTCTTQGKKVKNCVSCGAEMESAVIDAGHQPGDWEVDTDSTCSSEGKRVRKCKVCPEILETEIIPRKDHPFDGGPQCPACGEKNPNYIPPTEPPTDPSTGPTEGESSGE